MWIFNFNRYIKESLNNIIYIIFLIKINRESFKYLDRDKIKYLQTPQGFKFDLLHEAYKNLIKGNIQFSDDLSLLKNFKSDISWKFVDGDYSNFKITTKNDIELAKILLKWNMIYL